MKVAVAHNWKDAEGDKSRLHASAAPSAPDFQFHSTSTGSTNRSRPVRTGPVKKGAALW